MKKGQAIGNYTLQKNLDDETGATSDIWTATDKNDKLCLMKINQQKVIQFSRLQQDIKSLRRESYFLKKIKEENIPGIVKFLDHIVWEKGTEILVTEYMPTGNLAQKIKKDNMILNDVEILDIMHPLMKTIDYLHNQQGIAHRDIKLENVVLKVGKPVLIDFGSMSEVGSQTMEFGTQAYQTNAKTFDFFQKDEQALGFFMARIMQSRVHANDISDSIGLRMLIEKSRDSYPPFTFKLFMGLIIAMSTQNFDKIDCQEGAQMIEKFTIYHDLKQTFQCDYQRIKCLVEWYIALSQKNKLGEKKVFFKSILMNLIDTLDNVTERDAPYMGKHFSLLNSNPDIRSFYEIYIKTLEYQLNQLRNQLNEGDDLISYAFALEDQENLISDLEQLILEISLKAKLTRDCCHQEFFLKFLLRTLMSLTISKPNDDLEKFYFSTQEIIIIPFNEWEPILTQFEGPSLFRPTQRIKKIQLIDY